MFIEALLIIAPNWELQVNRFLKYVLYPYNRKLLGNKKEWAADIYNNMVETQMHYVEWKEPNTKGYILNDCIYVKLWKTQTNV